MSFRFLLSPVESREVMADMQKRVEQQMMTSGTFCL